MSAPGEESLIFEKRKKQHLDLALDGRHEAAGFSGFDRVQLVHEALPNINFDEIDIQSTLLGHRVEAPLFVSSMTAGNVEGQSLNKMLAMACGQKGWAMGVGSQRRELYDDSVSEEWTQLRLAAPSAFLMGNLGISQLIQTPLDKIEKLVDRLEAKGMIIHLNALQECMQPEGTPFFRGGLEALEKLVKSLSVPVIVKETGCGFSQPTLNRLNQIGVSVVDVSGLGGTHWGRIEGSRGEPNSIQARASQTFSNWGVSTLESLEIATGDERSFAIWASGGMRTGLDAAKALAIGAHAVGFAKPALQACRNNGVEGLIDWMSLVEFELKTALFCTGLRTPDELRGRKPWKKI